MLSLLRPGHRTFATKAMAGASKNNKDSAGRRLGLKKFGGEEVFPGEIIIRQRGRKFWPGENTYMGKDHTIHAAKEGRLAWSRDPWRRRKKTYVHVIQRENPNRALVNPPPFVYHPELYPDLAKNNPEPVTADLSSQ